MFNMNEFHDYVIVHGYGKPTKEGYKFGKKLICSGEDYATASIEVVNRGLTTEGE